MRALHPNPESTWRHNKGRPKEGYRHMPFLYLVEDEQLDGVTEGDSFEASFVRLIGVRHGSGKWERTMDSFITLDTFSIGLAHKTHSGFTDELAEFVSAHEALSVWAWGLDGASALKDEEFLHKMIARRVSEDLPQEMKDDPLYAKRNFKRWDWPSWWREEWNWFIAGWYEIARHPDTMSWYIDVVLNKARWASKIATSHGFTKSTTVAALARHANSYGNSGTKKRLATSIEKASSSCEDAIMDVLYSPGMYHKSGEAKRLKWIRELFERCPFPSSLSTDALNLESPVKRVDGSRPRFLDWEPML